LGELGHSVAGDVGRSASHGADASSTTFGRKGPTDGSYAL